MENQSVKGCIISRNEAKELLSQPPGIRIREIRLKLEAMYPGEFNLKKVAQDVVYSENGLSKLEKGKTNPHDETIETFTKFYSQCNVPHGFFDKEPVSSMKPFYLGKKEDMLPYFDRSYEANGQKHFLDDRELPEIDNDGDYPYYDPAIDYSEWDVIQGDDGEPTLNQIGVEINLNVYQVSTKRLQWVKRLNKMVVIPPNELSHFEQALRREVDVVVRQYSKMYELEEQLQNSQTRQRLLEMQLALKGKDQKSESDSALERLIGTLLKK